MNTRSTTAGWLGLFVLGAVGWAACSDDETGGGGVGTTTTSATTSEGGHGGSTGTGGSAPGGSSAGGAITTGGGAPGGASSGGSDTGGSGGAGPIEPEVLASGGAPASLAVDATHVYWVGTQAHRVPKGGGSSSVIPITGASGSYKTVVVDDTQLYLSPLISLDNRVWACPKAGGAATLIASTLGDTSSGSDFTIDATHVYWLESAGFGRVGKVAKNGTGAVALASDSSGPTGIAVYDGDVYWSNWVLDEIKSISLTGTDPATLATDEDMPWDVAVTSDGVFWVNRATVSTSTPATTGSVRRLEHGQSVAQSIATDQAGPHALVVDATHVYWTNYFDGTVMAAPIAGGAAVAIASGQIHPTAIAQDAAMIYWIDEEAETVMRVAK